MTKWEYKFGAAEAQTAEKKLNEYGAEGWELVEATFHPFWNQDLNMYRFIFKRSIQTKLDILLD